ncbi:MAG: hypothetical protein ABSF67_10350 [Roseiarcus sp.]
MPDEDDEETPPDGLETWLVFLSRRLTPEAWSALQQHLKKSYFDGAEAAFAPPPSSGRNLPAGAASAMDSAPGRRGTAADRSFLRRYPAAANIRTN